MILKGMAKKRDGSVTCYIYGLRAADSSDYFYIGSTSKAPADRLAEHILHLKRNKNRHFVNKMRKVGLANVVVDTLEVVTPENRFEREYAWIKRLLEDGVRLTNLVTNADTYPTVSRQNDYLERISNPRFVVAGFLECMCDGACAADPRDQPLFEALQRTTRSLMRHILTESPCYFGDLLSETQVAAILEVP